MPIKVECLNPDCGKSLRVPDQAAGKKIRCPACSNIMLVPEADPFAGELANSDSLSALAEADETASPVSPPPPSPTDRSLHGLSPAPPPPPARPAPRPDRRSAGGRRRSEPGAGVVFLSSIGFGFRSLSSLVGMMLILVGMNILFSLALGGVFLFAGLLQSNLIAISGVVLAGLITLAMIGYFGRFFEDVAEVSAEGSDEPPPVPEWQFGVLARCGLRIIGLWMVYVLPVVTLPLLPLGMMGIAISRNARGLNLGWALKTAGRRPKDLLAAWGAMLLSIPVTAGALVAVVYGVVTLARNLNPGSVVDGLVLVLIAIGAILLLQAIQMMMMVIPFRCGGLMARRDPQIVRDLHSSQVAAGYSCVGLGLLLTVVSLAIISQPLGDAMKGYVDSARAAAERQRQQEQDLEEQYRRQAEAREQALASRNRSRTARSSRRVEPSRRGVGGRTRRVEPPPPPRLPKDTRDRQAWLTRMHEKLAAYRREHHGEWPPSLAALSSADPSARALLAGAGELKTAFAYAPPLPDGRSTGPVLWDARPDSGDQHNVLLGNGMVQRLSRFHVDSGLRRRGLTVEEVADTKTWATRQNTPHRRPQALERLKELHPVLVETARSHRHPGKLADSLTRLGRNVQLGQSVASPNQSFGYVGEQTVYSDPNNVLAYSPRPYTDGKRAVLLFGGEVKVIDEADFQQALARTRQRHRQQQQFPRLALPEVPARSYRESEKERGDRAFATFCREVAEFYNARWGHFPASLAELKSSGRRPYGESWTLSHGGEPFVIVSGLTSESPDDHIVAYDPVPYGAGRCRIMTADGEIRHLDTVHLLNAQLRSQGAPQRVRVELHPINQVACTWTFAGSKPATVKTGHPLQPYCAVMREVDTRQGEAIVGVGFGTEADGMDSEGFETFLAEAKKAFGKLLQEAGSMGPMTEFRHDFGGRDGVYHRLLARQIGGNDVLIALCGVQDGRCVAYWFAGDSTVMGVLSRGRGRAKIIHPPADGSDP